MRTLLATRIALGLGLAALIGACDQDTKSTLVDAGDSPEVDSAVDEPDPGSDSDGSVTDEPDAATDDGGTPAASLEDTLLGADLVAPDPGKLEQDLMLPDEAFLPADLLPPG